MVKLTGRVWDFYDDAGETAAAGDVWLQAKLDTAGRGAVSGGHANMGYSGWFLGFVQAEGGKCRFLSLKIIFPEFQNGYAMQGDKRDTILRIEEALKALADLTISKVKGGWAFDVEVEAERTVALHWQDWNAPRGMSLEEAQAEVDRLNNPKRRRTAHVYTVEEILNRPESDMEKRVRLREGGIMRIGLSRT